MAAITLEVSSERLRMALPLMAKYKIPLTPENDRVWYQFIAGDIGPIQESIQRSIEAGTPIDEATTQALYRRYGDAQDQPHIVSAENTIRQLVESMTTSLKTVDSEVSRYEASLGECAQELAGDISADRLQSLVGALSKSTQRMHEGSSNLHSNLDESREEVKALKEELKHAKAAAKTDPMTRLANRIGFEDALEALRADPTTKSTTNTLLIADIDKFKLVNDTYGHIFGDKIIKVVAKALDNLTKGKDIAARFGGEEFVIVLPNATIDGGVAVSESIRRNIANGRIFNPKTKEEIQRITISIGVTEFHLDENINSVIERADAALYRANEGGRNRVEVANATALSAVANA